ncbi:MAG: TonB family protein [Ignavibacteriaceae bacterium]
MEIMKNIPTPEIRFRYRLVLKCSLAASLLFMIFAFKFFPHLEKGKYDFKTTQELFTLEDIQQTKQQDRTPPPPKPPIPIEAPSTDVLEDIEIAATEIDFDAVIESPPPLKYEEKKVVEEPVYFVAVEEMPYPIGGIPAIQKLIEYPEIAKRAGIQGKVYVLAYINDKGIVEKTEIIKGIGGGCDEAADYAVRHTKFSPGKQRGKPVYVRVMIPVVFRLSDSPA